MTTRMVSTSEKKFWYGGDHRKKGDEFEATDAHARLLHVMGKAEPAPTLTAKVVAKVMRKPTAEATPQKRKYTRRDMRAEA